ncbi:hypothetical protein Nepgr_023447 [Nepenthes gracilis]|uniref:Peptidase A1 domain-containing protein n=1 Tax=Nepenthes gracilis TaxID=150966 RepID=A0AAD3T192_NEPGR|nr:hypothetical protein Nepgr_023447 [Nepenthes gracilis]
MERRMLFSLACALFCSSELTHGISYFEEKNNYNNTEENRVVFAVGGNVYPDGHFYAVVHIGPQLKTYFLDLDTGSDLTWVQCDAPCVHCRPAPHPLYKPINRMSCNEPLCDLVEHPRQHPCHNPADECHYQVKYVDGGSSTGFLTLDTFLVGSQARHPLVNPLIFGCGYDQRVGSESHSPYVDGVLGLSSSQLSILSQLRNKGGVARNVIGHCLLDHIRRGDADGFLFFGDGALPPSLQWVPMSPPYERLQLILDSGSTFTYFNSHALEAVVTLINKDAAESALKPAPEDKTLPYCWKGRAPFRYMAEVERFFKPLALRFPNAANVEMEMPAKSHLIISSHGNACLGILNGTEIGLGDQNIIGDISFRERLVVYDNESKRIGWTFRDCKRQL